MTRVGSSGTRPSLLKVLSAITPIMGLVTSNSQHNEFLQNVKKEEATWIQKQLISFDYLSASVNSQRTFPYPVPNSLGSVTHSHLYPGFPPKLIQLNPLFRQILPFNSFP